MTAHIDQLRHLCKSDRQHRKPRYSRKNLPPLTDWFGSKIKPVHPGVYKVRFSDCRHHTAYAWWSGSEWGASYSSFLLARAYKRRGIQSKEWCGLSVEVR